MNPEARGRTTELVARRPALRDDLLQRAAAGELSGMSRAGLSVSHLEGFFDGRGFAVDELPVPEGPDELRGVDFDNRVEAVVRDFDRPTILVEDDTWTPPDNPAMSSELEASRVKLERALGRVGRIEFHNVPMLWGGTGWVVDDHLIITNRHVGEIVAQADGRGSFRFKPTLGGVAAEARIDFKAEHGADEDDASEEVSLTAVRYLAGASQPDIALFAVAKGVALPKPIALAAKRPQADSPVAVIGYPAFDSRSDRRAVDRYFGDIFEVKRLAPGVITQVRTDGLFFMHDATTLGGNSGSLVVEMSTGKAMGIHYAGQYHEGNYAHTAEQIKKALKGLRVMVAVPSALASLESRQDGSHPKGFFKGRTGYNPGFLGTGARRVPLPTLGAREADVAIATETGDKQLPELRYTHFSTKHSTSRRVPLLTACNIDGGQSKTLKRADDQWFTDRRIEPSLQLTETDYAHPDIDRGHMVRREDPNWGRAAELRRANGDTFHYTNAAPQHKDLNRVTTQWLGLEKYVLENARTHGLKISVFTGPILRDTDRTLDNGVQVPEEYWKIITALDAGTRRLRATGYVLSQGAFIEDTTESFAYGEYRTYQVAIADIAAKTGYDFDQLAAADALAQHEGLEAAPGMPILIPLDQLESMVL